MSSQLEDFDEICPNCARDLIDPTSDEGFCRRCTSVRRGTRQERWAPNGWRHANGERIPEVDFSNARLPRLERVIQTGLRSFVAVGSALKAIRDRRLYREAGFSTFENYCRTRWGFGRDYADKQISAAAFTSELASIETPTAVGNLTERHVRELARLPVAEAREVWTELVATYPVSLITGEVVRAEVDRRIGKPETEAETWWQRGC